VYDRVKAGVLEYDRIYFEQRADAVGTLGATTDQMLCIALCLLGQGIGADSAVELSRLSESTSAKCLKRICAAVTRAFGDQYYDFHLPTILSALRQLTANLAYPDVLGH
jgi:hypothetical protein